MTRRFAVTFVVLLILANCSKQDGNEYFPKESKGAQWEYSVEYRTELGEVQKGKMLERVDSEETINGKTYLKHVRVFSGIPGAESEISYCRRASEGLYEVEGKHKDLPEYLDTPFPVTIGKTWTVQGPDGQTQCKAETVETLEMFDRKYEKCLKVSYKDHDSSGNSDGYMYYAPGIGLVKLVHRQGGIIMEFTLDKYKL